MSSKILNKRGKLFILSGPSGAGKGTLRERALKNVEDLVYSISCTTRPPRAGETNGIEYRFISLNDFEDRIKLNKFLEYANVHGCYYGTLRADVERELDAGRDVLLEIDVQGAEQVKNILHDAILIFIMPPSREILEARLRARMAIIAFIGLHASQCRAVTAKKVAQAIGNWDKNPIVRNQIINYFK